LNWPCRRLELVAGPHVDRVVELALADQLRAFLQRADGARHARAEEQRSERREQEAAQQQDPEAHDRRVEARQDLRCRLHDEHFPAQRLDPRVRGQDFGAAGVAGHDDALLGSRSVQRGPDVGEPGEVGLAQHEPDVRVGDQVALRIDDVGLALLADLDARDHVPPHELEVHVGDGDRAGVAAGAHGDLHVRLGLLAERDASVPRARGGRLEERRVAAAIAQAVARGVHREARHLRLLAAVRADPGDVGDAGHLLQELEELEAALLGPLGAELRQRRALELRLHLQDVLLDALRGGDRLLVLQRVQGVQRLAVREPERDRRGDQQRRGDEREDQDEVLAEQAAATAGRGVPRAVRTLALRCGQVHRRGVATGGRRPRAARDGASRSDASGYPVVTRGDPAPPERCVAVARRGRTPTT
jgi:hypothetical protein